MTDEPTPERQADRILDARIAAALAAAPVDCPADNADNPLPIRRRTLPGQLRYLSRKVTEAVNELPAGAPRGTLLGVAMSLSLTADQLDAAPTSEAGR